MVLRDILAALVALVCIGLGLFLLERPRAGLEISSLMVGETPATVMQVPETTAPVVVIAHGFAGSRQLMHPYQLTLARAGYITVSYDLQGHGRNPLPMSGDVNSIDGTTRLLMEEIGRVTDAALALPGADGRVALLGHSMASDIIVRQALADDRVGAVVAISLFSEAVTAAEPENMLVVNGAWEGALRAEAQRIMAEVGAAEGDTVGTPGEGFARRAVAAPMVEHVGVLYSATGMREAREWLNATFGRDYRSGIANIGGPVLLTLLGVVLLGLPLANLLAEGPRLPEVPKGAFLALALAPAVLTPLILSLVETRFLPVLVADYLALHLAVYGSLVLAGLAVEGDLPKLRGGPAGILLAGFALIAFGGVLDRYVASFFPHAGRLPILAAILPGAVLAMVADAALLQAGRARIWRRWVARLAFLTSLGIAVALDFERLFFLIIILPVIGLFYLSFGVIGGWVGRRTGSALAMGLGLGIVLAWALAVTFPLFTGTT
ncbi:alpha/beta hydrolase [Rhodophyticola porphyridii]|uniref:alpha/beta hydrolase n=1 Tax=Rhodophyticola porphyridii TaxID=1852017 RepID=UPI0035D088E1